MTKHLATHAAAASLGALLLLSACATRPAPAPEPSVRPGVNESYLDPDLEVSEWVERFEREGREIYDHREAIAAAAQIQPGWDIADIGAGTGLFIPHFSQAVGPGGTVYAVDIVPGFLEHIEERAAQAGLQNVETILATERSAELPPDSIDLAFICDVYHHFEYPQSTLASLHRALRPGGQIFMVEFKREPGVSSEWAMNHVRAGQEEFTREIEAAGFEKIGEVEDLLEDNYILRFRKVSR